MKYKREEISNEILLFETMVSNEFKNIKDGTRFIIYNYWCNILHISSLFDNATFVLRLHFYVFECTLAHTRTF